MRNFKDLKPIPHLSTPTFKEHRIPKHSVAQALNLSYGYVCSMVEEGELWESR